MKRIFSIICIFCLLPLLFVTAAADEDPRLSTLVHALLPDSTNSISYYSFDDSDYYFFTPNSLSEYGIYVDTSQFGSTSMGRCIYSFDFTIIDYTKSGTDFFPTHVYYDYGLSSQGEIPLSSKNQFEGNNLIIDFKYSVDDQQAFNVFSCTVFVYNNGRQDESIFIQLPIFETIGTGKNPSNNNVFIGSSHFTYGSYTPDSTNADIVSAINSLIQAENLSREELKLGFAQVASSIEAASEAVSDEVQEGLKGYTDTIKQEATDKIDTVTGDVGEQLDFNINGLQNSLQNLYNAVTTTSADPVLTFPSITIPVLGKSYKLSDAVEIRFADYIQPFQGLLYVLRFVVYMGFGWYLLHWIKKIESIVTLNSSGD